MIMSNDFQFQYANPCSLPYISYKMKYASIILNGIYQISLLITSSFSFVFAIWKLKKKIISPLSSPKVFADKWRHLACYWLAVWNHVVINISIAYLQLIGGTCDKCFH